MLLAVFSFALGAAPMTSDAESVYLPRNLYLVRVMTQRVWREPKEDFDRGRLRVTQVLAGPANLHGREFEATTECPFPFGSGPMRVNSNIWIEVLKKGTEGLWWVFEDAEDKTLRPILDAHTLHELGIGYFPYQKNLGLSLGEPANHRFETGPKLQVEFWKEGEAIVKGVAEVYAAKTDKERRVLLERYAATEGSPIATWAIAMLARGPREPAARYLMALVKNDKLEATSQIKLDELLCELDAKGWVGSKDRKRLLVRWLDVSVADFLFHLGCNRLKGLGGIDLDAAMFVEVVSAAVARADLMSEGKVQYLADLLRSTPHRLDEADKRDQAMVMDLLADVVRTAKSGKLIRAAIDSLIKLRH